MLKIRLQRVGRKHEPSFRLVLTDSKNSTKSGRYIEVLGNYDSRRGEKASFKGERILELMSKGAKVSDTVHNLLIDQKIITAKKVNKLPLKKPIKKEVESSAEAPKVLVEETQAETPSEDNPKTE